MSNKKKIKPIQPKIVATKDDLELIKQLRMYENVIKDENNQRRADTATIMLNLSEFLDSYIIVGYDLTGTAIQFSQARTQKDRDSLSTLLTAFINKELDNGDSL